MGRHRFLAFLVVSVIFLSTVPQGGMGRKIHVMRHFGTLESPETLQQIQEESGMTGRGMMAMDMDYKEPGPNPDTRNGRLFDDSSSPSPSPLR